MDHNTHKILIDQYLSLGGSKEKINSILSFSLGNHARLKYCIKQLNAVPAKIDTTKPASPTTEPDSKRKSIFSDLISYYPVELHQAYKMRYDHWLEACSLKVLLNEVDIKNEEKALEIQWKMFDNLESMDKYQKALEYYNEHKRIIETETKETFDDLSPMELIKKRQNLRSNISKRINTLKKMEESLPEKGAEDYNLRLHLINRKTEEIQQLKNRVVKLDEIINK